MNVRETPRWEAVGKLNAMKSSEHASKMPGWATLGKLEEGMILPKHASMMPGWKPQGHDIAKVCPGDARLRKPSETQRHNIATACL